ncbi:hypothetical protein GH733_004619 [Mirounga leonina]|nr:hypothetical protein GH733_004619 [Mirounga leonina]
MDAKLRLDGKRTSNFAHVIFQNVAKSYLPNAHLECHYTLTPYIHPHPKDWVGIFKVGWSTACDYYTILWSPMPEHYIEESTVNCVLAFQGYCLPNDDGEFYQFCYVTHKGEIHGTSKLFQFQASPVEELLTVEDEGNSDMLVVTKKLAFEKQHNFENKLEDWKESLTIKKIITKLKTENEEIKKRYNEATSKALRLEEDIVSVTHKAIEKETELDSLKDKLWKAQYEREQLEYQLKMEKDEKELYKVHLKNTEIENTKLEQLHKQRNMFRQLGKKFSSGQRTISDAVNVQDKTMADLHTAHLEKS